MSLYALRLTPHAMQWNIDIELKETRRDESQERR